MQAFLEATFPEDKPRALPNYIFYDNACNLLEFLLANGERWISSVGLVVDVFHAVTKHKDTDEFCQRHCNPAGFRELLTDLQEWLFNSSAAEQVNVWFGDFGPIVREMTEVHHEFFLDEMIAIYNEHKVSELWKRGCRPRIVPDEELSLPRII